MRFLGALTPASVGAPAFCTHPAPRGRVVRIIPALALVDHQQPHHNRERICHGIATGGKYRRSKACKRSRRATASRASVAPGLKTRAYPARKRLMVIAIWTAKGGAGKTTTAVSLGAVDSWNKRRVLLADLDPQASATRALGLEPAPGLLDVLRGKAKAADRIVPVPGVAGLEVLPGSPELVAAERELAGEPGAERLLALALRPALRRYSLLVIDTGPGVNLLSVSALAAADVHLAPVTPSALALGSLPDTLALADRVRARLNRKLAPTRILLCAWNRSRIAQDAGESLRQRFKGQVLRTEIPRAQAVETAAARRVPVVTLRPDSPVASAYKAAARELVRTGRKS